MKIIEGYMLIPNGPFDGEAFKSFLPMDGGQRTFKLYVSPEEAEREKDEFSYKFAKGLVVKKVELKSL